MIAGLKLRVTSDELKELFSQRAAYHRKRADEKQAEVPLLKEAMERIKTTSPATTVSQMNKSSYRLDADDPVKDLETDIRNHQNKAVCFDFFREHLFTEDYTLDEHDLVRLEILRG